MSLNIRQGDWAGILLYWLFSHIDEMILHDPTRYYDQSVITNAKNQFCKYEYTKIQGNGDFENAIKEMQKTLELCNTPEEIYRGVCYLFYCGKMEIIPNKGLVINSSSTGEKYIIPQKYKKKRVIIVLADRNQNLDIREKYICHLCELVYCQTWQFFSENLCRMSNGDVPKKAPMRYKDFGFDWGIFVWHKRCELIDCPYDEGALKFIFNRMVTNAE